MAEKICVVSSYAYITMHNNYGALLQYYALEYYLKSRGHNVFWLRYRFKFAVAPYVWASLVKHLFPHMKIILGNIFLRHAFMRFCKTKIECSSKIYIDEVKLEQKFPFADRYITGSDQVFGGTLKVNFLRFVKDKNKKIAYAASFGRDFLTDEQISSGVPEWLRDFHAVSVREKSGVALCAQYGVCAEHVLDPTLLIDSSVYKNLCNKEKYFNYVQCYFMNLSSVSDVFFHEIQKFCTEKLYKLRITSLGESARLFPSKYLYFPSPEKWLTSYCGAEYIVTNTFHGMVFAIIFHKPFAVVMQKGETESSNNRLYSLLKKLNLLACIYTGERRLYEHFSSLNIDWKYVDMKIQAERKKTDTFFEREGL